MADPDPYSPTWRRPEDVIKIRKLKTKKRALQDRLFDCDSPTKRAKRLGQKKGKGAQPPPPDESTLDDSTLMDLLGLKNYPKTSTPLARTGAEVTFHTHSDVKPINFSLSASPSTSTASSQMSSQRERSLSPLRNYLPGLCDGFESPVKAVKRRTLIPNRIPVSPSFSPKAGRSRSRVRRRSDDKTDDEDSKDQTTKSWRPSICLDWSLKAGLRITSANPFAWSSNNLKTSEESSGTSSFVRCIDIEPSGASNSSFPSMGNSQLDTTLGAQFHQCSLYWQHPSLPTVSLFPRDVHNTPGSGTNKTAASLRFDQKVLDCLQSEWIDAFRSAFQLLRVRQSPFFYICANLFTCLFCSAGTQGDEETQIYVTPATKGLRDALKADGITFSTPYFEEPADKPSSESQGSHKEPMSPGTELDSSDDDDPDPEWLAKLGISPHSTTAAQRSIVSAEEKTKSTLIMIAGDDSLAFFNFLLNSKTFLITNRGPTAGLPPTILSPVAFHGATLKTLKVKQSKVTAKDEVLHSIDMSGPILPHVMHMLCSLLTKTVVNYRIKVSTLGSTVPLNLYSKVKPTEEKVKPSVFELSNLSDCGLKKSILEIFCKFDNCHTIQNSLESRDSKYKWS